MALFLLGAAVFLLFYQNRERLFAYGPGTTHQHFYIKVNNVHHHYHFHPLQKGQEDAKSQQYQPRARHIPKGLIDETIKKEELPRRQPEEDIGLPTPSPSPRLSPSSGLPSKPKSKPKPKAAKSPAKIRASPVSPITPLKRSPKLPPDLASLQHRLGCPYYYFPGASPPSQSNLDMPFVANTPESRLGRSDSKNPNATCRGVTSTGTSCRRPVSPDGRKKTLDPSLESSYCWQHKDQSRRGTHSSPGPLRPLQEGDERSSLDTLADRMGLMSLDDNRRYTSKEDNGRYSSKEDTKPTSRISQIRCCFCFVFDIEDFTPDPQPAPARPQPRPLQNQTSVPMPGRPLKPHSAPAATGRSRSRRTGSSRPARSHADYILPSTDAQTTLTLMKELSRPYVDSEEAGYIYMFWMTPESKSSPPVDAARSLLAPPSSRRSRSPSDVVSSYTDDRSASSPRGRSKPKKMLLKIGRAANVQRRMNQWQRQCGYDVEVLRFYPYIPSGSNSSGSSTNAVPRMTPHCHRVERLIHLELIGLGLKKGAEECEACGREHREWFEVEASRDGIRVVDEIIRRWISWDEAQP